MSGRRHRRAKVAKAANLTTSPFSDPGLLRSNPLASEAPHPQLLPGVDQVEGDGLSVSRVDTLCLVAQMSRRHAAISRRLPARSV